MRKCHHRPEPQQTSVTVPIDTQPAYITGTVTIPPMPAPTQRGWDAVIDLGLDPTGNFDCSEILQAYLDEPGENGELHFPPGQYYFAATVATNSKNIKLVGDGQLANMGNAPVVFFTDQELDAILWWNGALTNSNMNGPRIENIQFQDMSPSHNLLRCAIRLTATANSELKIGLLNLVPRRYTAGTVSVQLQSNTVTGQGTTWTAGMAPGWMVINGYPYEILRVDSPTSLVLAIAYQGATAAGLSYAVNWGGMGVWCEPGTDFTQYGKDWSLNGRCGCALFASAGTAEPGNYSGTSRIKVKSGYVNGEGIPDSIACYLGPYSDTFVWDVAMNSYSYSVVIANGHQHDIQHVDCENAGPPPPVTGRPVEHNSCYGVLVMSSNSSDTWGNRIGGYFRQVGTAIELYGAAGKAPNYTVLGVCTFRSNKATFVPGNATNTIGADVYVGTASWGDDPPCELVKGVESPAES
jgi:hypothetical protein